MIAGRRSPRRQPTTPPSFPLKAARKQKKVPHPYHRSAFYLLVEGSRGAPRKTRNDDAEAGLSLPVSLPSRRRRRRSRSRFFFSLSLLLSLFFFSLCFQKRAHRLFFFLPLKKRAMGNAVSHCEAEVVAVRACSRVRPQPTKAGKKRKNIKERRRKKKII